MKLSFPKKILGVDIVTIWGVYQDVTSLSLSLISLFFLITLTFKQILNLKKIPKIS